MLLQRTPYNRAQPATGLLLASHGYVVVLQDTRGRYESEGTFYPFRDEGRDGYDTVEWAAAPARRPTARWACSAARTSGPRRCSRPPPSPRTSSPIFPYVTASEYYEGWTYQSGAFMQWFASTWASILAEDTARKAAAGALALGRLDRRRFPSTSSASSTCRLPAELAPYYRDWVQHETDDDYWRSVKVKDHFAEMGVKALHGGGWHDLFLKGSIENYAAFTRRRRLRRPARASGCCSGPGATGRRRTRGRSATWSSARTPSSTWTRRSSGGSTTP